MSRRRDRPLPTARVIGGGSRKDKETRRQGDKETRRQGDKHCHRILPVSPSPCLRFLLSCMLAWMSDAGPANLLLQDIEYQFEQTAWGSWRRFLYPTGARFAEFTSHRSWGGLPLVHYTYGR